MGWGGSITKRLIGALTACLLATTPARAAFPEVFSDELLILKVRTGGIMLSDALLAYETDSGTCVLLDDFAAALEFPITTEGTVASGWLFRPKRTFRLDLETEELELEGRARFIGPGDVYLDQGLPCVTLEAAGRWFGLKSELIKRDALLQIESAIPLPAQERENREKIRKRMRTALGETDEDLERADLVPYAWASVPHTDFNLRYVSEEAGERVESDLLAIGDLGKMSTEILVRGDTDRGLLGVRGRIGRRAPQGILPRGPRITEMALGDIETPAGRLSAETIPGRGAIISSRRLGQPDVYDRTTVEGDAIPGWEVELYRNKTLLDAQIVDETGRYRFLNVPLLFGNNRFVLELYGPEGQRRREVENVVVGDEALPKGESEFTIAANQQRVPTFYAKELDSDPDTGSARVGALLAYGLGQSTALTVGTQTYQFDGERLSFFDAGIRSGLKGIGLFVDSSFQNGGGSAFSIGAQKGLSAGLITARLETFSSYVSERARAFGDDTLSSRAVLNSEVTARLPGQLFVPLAVTLSREERTSGRSDDQLAIRANTRFGSASINQQIGVRRIVIPGLDVTENISGRTLISRRGRWLNLRAEADYRFGDDRSFDRISGTAEYRAGKSLFVRLTGAHLPRTEQNTVSLGINAVTNWATFGVSGTRDPNEEVSFRASLAISAAKTPTRKPRLITSRRSFARTGTAFVRPFIDTNADGAHQEGEQVLESTIVVNGRAYQSTEWTSEGALIRYLRLDRPSAVTVDLSSVPSDDVILVAPEEAKLLPRAGRTPVIDLPLTPSGDMIGQTKDEISGIILSDVALELVDEKGAVIAETRSLFDGYFIFENVPLGGYLVRIAPDQRERLGIGSISERWVVLSEGVDIIEGLEMLIDSTAAGRFDLPTAAYPYLPDDPEGERGSDEAAGAQ
ncbi:hypothetical protein HK107_04025 [Parvularcula sp. ZS-1/3]|uniref:Carboxypeptidase regulatory-like domain-containing protein n=1 Tax=Parvularcula mediterranea TaxID=2732508 RepID=A0A7Y3W4I5_9PROT|nr:hypothetical protein [Parvularcula mediterranea]NNU15488.1 hypothetical protein [Parvularcula mediterranea]